MNIFEDLIEELREENLLEQTAMQSKAPKKNPVAANGNAVKKDEPAAKVLSAAIPEVEMIPEPAILAKAGMIPAPAILAKAEMPPKIDAPAADSAEPAESSEDEAARKKTEVDFYRKRAMNEVSFLQMVEYVFAGVEREQLKIVPKPYDDLEVKKILHSFLQNAHDPQSSEHATTQFQLLRETESWHMSLSLRDAQILTAHLRRFCETSRPPLGSPALAALARFYRNSTYSEAVRSKFDLVVTRLFSKETGGSKREAIFKREELVQHLTELYADWSSVSTYPTETDDQQLADIVSEFEKFRNEAEQAAGFDDLIDSDFFNRLHSFKESTNANFFAPQITATAVESNINIGNRYVELLESEKQRSSVADLENKYGLAHDQKISEATGKTFALIELLNQKAVEAPIEEPIVYKESEPEPVTKYQVIREEKVTAEGLSNNAKYLIGAAAVLLLIVVIYFVGDFGSGVRTVKMHRSANAQTVHLEDAVLKDHLAEAYVQDGVLNGIIISTWANMTKDEKIGVVNQMLKLGKEKGYSEIQLADHLKTLVASGKEGDIYIAN